MMVADAVATLSLSQKREVNALGREEQKLTKGLDLPCQGPQLTIFEFACLPAFWFGEKTQLTLT